MDVYQYTANSNGGTPLSSYPYRAQVVNSCNPGSRKRVSNSQVKAYYAVPKGESTMMEYLVNYGPLDIVMEIYNSFYSYQGGIYTSVTNDKSVGYHAVIIVGYGVSGDTKYWIVKVKTLTFCLNFKTLINLILNLTLRTLG